MSNLMFALPSPRGTNREGLFSRPLGLAADAAPRRARDADPDDLMGAMSSLQTHLKSKLTGDDFGVANQLLGKVMDMLAPQGPDDNEEPDDDEPAQDKRRKLAGDGHRDPRPLAKRFGDIAMPTQLGPRRR